MSFRFILNCVGGSHTFNRNLLKMKFLDVVMRNFSKVNPCLALGYSVYVM